jgi:GTPase SAR1 family protein
MNMIVFVRSQTRKQMSSWFAFRLPTRVLLRMFGQRYNLASQRTLTLQWYPEVKHHCPNVPMLLIGTKIDLREDPKILAELARQNKTPMAYTQGLALCKQLGMVKYMECSAATDQKSLKVTLYCTLRQLIKKDDF